MDFQKINKTKNFYKQFKVCEIKIKNCDCASLLQSEYFEIKDNKIKNMSWGTELWVSRSFLIIILRSGLNFACYMQ